jgi:hypothetical protein
VSDQLLSCLEVLTDPALDDIIEIWDISAGAPYKKQTTIQSILASLDLGINDADGIDINPGSDIDCDLLTVGVTGAPKLWWDESLDCFILTKRLAVVTATAPINSSDVVVFVGRTVDNSVAGNGHCFGDYSTVTRTGSIGYNSFNSQLTVSGAGNYDHFAAFQAASTFGTAGTIDRVYGLYSATIVSAGTVTDSFGVYVGAASGAGAVTNDYGIYLGIGTKGATKNYAIYSAGAAASFHQGNIGVGTLPLANTGLKVGGDSAAVIVGLSSMITTTGDYPVLLNLQGGSSGTGGFSAIFGIYNRMVHASSGTLASFYGIYSAPTSSGGTTTNLYHVYIADAAGAGTVTNQYGLYVAALAKGGTLNYAIWINGANPIRTAGAMHFVNSSAPTPLTDGACLYATDQAAGNACIHAKTEHGEIIKLYQQAHIADAAGGTEITTINAILTALENNGLLAAA